MSSMAVDGTTSRISETGETNYLSRVPTKSLGQDEFLKLLTTQMSYQDPMNPQKDTDFIAQMASFSSLENSRALRESQEAIRADQEVLKANSILGRTVEIRVTDQTTTSGVVTAVHVTAGKPQVEVNGERFPLSSVITITPTPTETNEPIE